jgi:hypothetical protein
MDVYQVAFVKYMLEVVSGPKLFPSNEIWGPMVIRKSYRLLLEHPTNVHPLQNLTLYSYQTHTHTHTHTELNSHKLLTQDINVEISGFHIQSMSKKE